MIPTNDKQIRLLLRDGLTPQQIAHDYDLPLKRVCRIQTQGESAHDPARPQPFPVGFRLPKGIALATEPTAQYAGYWQGWNEAHGLKPRPHRVAHLVPDDRADEAIDFEQFLMGTAAVLSAGARRGEGRGAA